MKFLKNFQCNKNMHHLALSTGSFQKSKSVLYNPDNDTSYVERESVKLMGHSKKWIFMISLEVKSGCDLQGTVLHHKMKLLNHVR
jgi:hypothetical protein